MKSIIFVLLCVIIGAAVAGTWGGGNRNNGPYGGRGNNNNGGGYRSKSSSHESSSSESKESKECKQSKPPCKEAFSCEKEPLFELVPGIQQKCEIGADSETKEIDCQRCCETWGLAKGVGKDKQSGTYDWTNNDCYCCKLECPPRPFPFG